MSATTPIHQLAQVPSPRRPPTAWGTNIPCEADVTSQGGTAANIVKDPTAGSYEALVAGNAAAIGYLRCLDSAGGEVRIVTCKPS